jgi:hypothetical protein
MNGVYQKSNLKEGIFMSKKKMTRFDLLKLKQEGQKAVWITAYDYWTASFAEQAGMDMILGGRFSGNVHLRVQRHGPGNHGPMHLAQRGGEAWCSQYLYYR